LQHFAGISSKVNGLATRAERWRDLDDRHRPAGTAEQNSESVTGDAGADNKYFWHVLFLS
jgi:hypothetical protein